MEKLLAIGRQIISFIFPPEPLVAELEATSPIELRKIASRVLLPPADFINSCFDYHTPLIRQAIWELKYRGNPKVASLLGKILSEEITAELAEKSIFEKFNSPLLIPIPLSKKRRQERGFNQSELLAEEIIKNDSQKILMLDTKSFIKTKDTSPQTKISREQRLKNLADCFEVARPEAVRGRNIILIDDVSTTGATLKEARRTLLASGAKSIIAFTLAH
ncbi:MAG: phosphoribosyltransferase family protein [Candidatus Paceibacterota bacterium]|jgi:ComF family protein